MSKEDMSKEDMSEAELANDALIKGDGFYVLENLITPEEAAYVREFVLAHLDEGEERNTGDINLSGLLTEDPVFQQIVTQPRLLAVAHRLLGPDAKLAAFTAKTLMPECKKGRLHIDYPYWAMDHGMPVEPALMMQVIWMMQPVNEENGGTWVAPASQLYNEPVDIDRFKSEAVQVTGNAGDAFLSHGLLWHQTAVNQSTEPRVALLINYSQLAIRPMKELGPFSEAFVNSASPELLELLPLDYAESLSTRLSKNY